MSSRDRILEVAATRFLEEGYHNTRMGTIARDAGISRTALYNHFSNKEAILLALHQRVIDEARQEDLPLLKSDAPPAQRLADWLRNTLTNQWRHHAVRVIQLEETQGILINDSSATQDIINLMARELARLIREGIRSGDFRSDLNAKSTSYLLQGLVMGIHRNNVSVRPMFTISTQRDIDRVVSILVSGLRP